LPVVSTPKSLPADEVASAAGPGEKNAEPKRDPEVVVHVAGAVKHPGVYHLHAGARNDDAVKAAGGLAGNANEASVNLAAPAVDGAQLYIKNQTEQPSGGAGEDGSAAPPITSSVRPGKSAGASKPATKASNGVRPESSKPAKLKDPSEGKINLNTASSEELQRISGIGPAMAEKIISYRQESHGFQSIDDLLQISGVGAKKLAKWSPFLKLH
jgi:competence protein ComEA